MEDDDHATSKMGGIKLEDATPNGVREEPGNHAVAEPNYEDDQYTGPPQDDTSTRSDSAETPSSQKPAKASRKASQPPPRDPMLYGALPDMTTDSCETFQVIPDCLYGSKHLGSTDHDSFDCDCSQEWRKQDIPVFFSMVAIIESTVHKFAHTLTARVDRR